MIDINEIRDRLIKTVIENKLEHINSAILEDYEAYEIIIDIRIEKRQVGLYSSINTIPEINLDDILPKGDKGPL